VALPVVHRRCIGVVERVFVEIRVTFESTKSRDVRGEVGRTFSSLETGQMSSD
jgi:hypothetical protein